MRAIYHFIDYKAYLNHRISCLPKNGRGELLRISKYLSVHTSLISQVLNGVKEFSLEQGIKVSDYFGLTDKEQDYFMLLINYSRSGTKKLKAYYLTIIEKMQSEFFTIKSRVPKATRLDDSQKSQYYSDWKFMAVWLATSLEKIKSIDDIEAILKISKRDIAKIMDFLISVGLCVNSENGLNQGVSTTHLDKESLLINRHHTNWRLKAIEKLEDQKSNEFFFTAPLTISIEDIDQVKKELLDVIERTSKKIETTNPEKLACLNIDLFQI